MATPLNEILPEIRLSSSGDFGHVEHLDPPVPTAYIGKNHCGKITMILQDDFGYTYSSKYTDKSNSRVTWRCSQKNTRKCKASCVVEFEKIIMKRNLHTHSV